MKRIDIFSPIFILLLLCIPILSRSQSDISENFIEVTVNKFIPCANEFATGTVTLHAFHVYNKQGKIYKSHAQPMGGRLIGQETGTVYNVVGVSQSKETSSYNGEAYTFSGIDNFHLVGVGKYGMKYKIHLVVKYTINANGEVTVDIDRESTTCGVVLDLL